MVFNFTDAFSEGSVLGKVAKKLRLSNLSKRHQHLLIHLLPLLLSLIIGVITAIKLGQDQNWDLLNYHYFSPYALIHGLSKLSFAPAQLQTYYNPLLDIPSYLLINHLRPIIAGSALGAIQGLNIWLIYEIALVLLKGFQKKMTKTTYIFAFVLAAFSFFGATNLAEVGGTMDDNLVSIPILISLFMILKNIEGINKYIKTHNRLWRLGAYFVAGLAVGLKLSVGPMLIGLLFLEVFNSKRIVEFIKNEILNGLAIFAGLLVTYLFWAIHLIKLFNSPFFPYFNKIFHSPYYFNQNIYGVQYPPHGLIQTIFYPLYFMHKQHLVSEEFFKDPRLGVLLIGLILFGVYYFVSKNYNSKLPRPTLTKPVVAIFSFIIISYVIWEKMYSYYRYLIVVEFLALVAIACLVISILSFRRIALVISMLIIIPIVFITSPMNYGHISWQSSWFGVGLPSKYITSNSTVLITGNDPVAFLVPFFPRGINFIRTQENLVGTGKYQDIISNNIKIARQNKDVFYDLITADQTTEAKLSNEQYGFKVKSCRPIHTYTSQYLDNNLNFYQLCRLTNS